MSKHYISPSKDRYLYTCPHCNTLSQMERDTHHFASDVQNTVTGLGAVSNELLYINACVAILKLFGLVMNMFILI